MLTPSIRYQSGPNDVRSLYMRLCAWLQKQPVTFIDDDPRAIGAVLASSTHKGRFLEERIACPAWEPVLSVESVDGPEWKALASVFRKMFRQLPWRERLAEAVADEVQCVAKACAEDPDFLVDATVVSRLTAGALHRVVFGHAPADEVRDLLYQASIEWRKEIAIKGRGDRAVKDAFMAWLEHALETSSWAELLAEAEDPVHVLSAFAQPLLISPQINLADIFVTLFDLLEADPELEARVRGWAADGRDDLLLGSLMEATRLGHPFPVLERWLPRDVDAGGRRFEKGTQVFMMMDSLKQDPTVEPERWTGPREDNPYADLPFGSGPRMCTGRPLAERLMVELLRGLLFAVPPAQLRPQDGNPYSGRKNDGKDDLKGVLHQLSVFGKVLVQSARLGARGEGKCPFHAA